MQKTITVLCVAVLLAGCASSHKKQVLRERYPVPKMLDPVTEGVPNVKR
jgi:uncharacterized lipoprotein YajG